MGQRPVFPGIARPENTNGLIVWWPFDDGTATDNSGSAYYGTLTNAPSVVGASPLLLRGKPGNHGLAFNGTSSYVVGSRALTNPLVTISAWVKINGNSASNRTIAGYVNGFNNSTGDKVLAVAATTGIVKWFVFAGSNVTVTGTKVVTDNQWHHIVGVANGTNAILYIDGVSDGSAAAGATFTSYTVPNIFVAAPQGSGNPGTYLACSVFDFRVYNRGLLPGEVNDLYNRGLVSVGELELPMRLAPLVNKALAAGAGTYALTGAATTTVLHKYWLTAAASNYALTGTAATIRPARKIAALGGAYSLTGAATTSVLHKGLLTAAPLSYALTGATVAFQIRSNKFLSAATGGYILSGSAASILHRYKSAALGGSYALSGSDAAVTKLTPKVLAAAAGSYALSGAAAALLHRWKPAALAGSYALIGSAATVRYGRKIAAAPSSYALTGAAASFTRAERVIAASGSYALTGSAALVKYQWRFPASAGAYGLSGSAATLRRGNRLAAASGAYALTGGATVINWIRLRAWIAAPGSYNLTGNVARLFTGEPVLSERIVTVAGEDRSAETLQELRTVAALSENRIVAALPESRSIAALTESRTIEVQGANHGVSEMVP